MQKSGKGTQYTFLYSVRARVYKGFRGRATVYITVWWYTYAPAVKTFLAQYKLAGKTILPFATNGGWIGHTAKDIKGACPDSDIGEILNVRFDGARLVTPEKRILEWIKKV